MRVVHADRWLLVVEKPAGLATQAPAGGGPNLYDALRADHPGLTLHHRLDAAVSGLVLFGRDPSVNAGLAAAFRDHAIARTYLAVGSGEAVDGAWTRPVEGRPAHTDVVVLGRGSGRVALCLRPRTGRKHQLRVHAALAGVPLCGDRVHGGAAAREWPRLALHAFRLGLTHPATGAHMGWESPLPEDLRPLWALAGGPEPFDFSAAREDNSLIPIPDSRPAPGSAAEEAKDSAEGPRRCRRGPGGGPP